MSRRATYVDPFSLSRLNHVLEIGMKHQLKQHVHAPKSIELQENTHALVDELPRELAVHVAKRAALDTDVVLTFKVNVIDGMLERIGNNARIFTPQTEANHVSFKEFTAGILLPLHNAFQEDMLKKLTGEESVRLFDVQFSFSDYSAHDNYQDVSFTSYINSNVECTKQWCEQHIVGCANSAIESFESNPLANNEKERYENLPYTAGKSNVTNFDFDLGYEVTLEKASIMLPSQVKAATLMTISNWKHVYRAMRLGT